MRVANLDGRLALINGAVAVDVAEISGGRFDAAPHLVYERWDDFVQWATALDPATVVGGPFDEQLLGPPSPAPRQVFAIGLNYSDHAAEAGFTAPDTAPPVFTKFPTCLKGPYGDVVLPTDGDVDWEVELVVVIGRRAERIAPADAWACVAGLAVGQDLSERRSQLAGPSPQFSLAKSFPGFGPVGPWLVTVDEFADPDDLAISCHLNGETVQQARTSQLLFDVSAVLSRLSAVTPLLPGDLVFTGTPAGVGMGRTPPRWLAPGDVLVSTIEGVGVIRQRFIAEEDVRADHVDR